MTLTTLSTEPQVAPAEFDQCWYPIALSSEVGPGQVVGRDFLDGRVVAFRGASGEAAVVSAYCRHLGTDLARGEVIGDDLRCGFHYWQFAADGHCSRIPVCDRIPEDAGLFKFPTAESLGLIWAFNGVEATYDVPTWPGVDPGKLTIRLEDLGEMDVPHWLATANSMDFQHLEVVHGVPNEVEFETIDIGDHYIEYDMTWHDPAYGRIEQHIKDFGTNVVSILGEMGGVRVGQFFAGRPLPGGRTHGYVVAGVPSADEQGLPEDVIEQQLELFLAYGTGLIADDMKLFAGVRFRIDKLVPADRGLTRFFRYVEKFPKAHPSARFIT